MVHGVAALRLESDQLLLDITAQCPGVLVTQGGFDGDGVGLDFQRVRRPHVEPQEAEGCQVALAQHAVEPAALAGWRIALRRGRRGPHRNGNKEGYERQVAGSRHEFFRLLLRITKRLAAHRCDINQRTGDAATSCAWTTIILSSWRCNKLLRRACTTAVFPFPGRGRRYAKSPQGGDGDNYRSTRKVVA